MIYLLWALINIGLFVYFIGICLKVTRLIRDNLGTLAACIFVFGLLSYVGNSSRSAPENAGAGSWKLAAEDTLDIGSFNFIYADLDSSWLATYQLGIEYATIKGTSKNVVLKTHSLLSGLQSGTNWVATSVSVYPTPDNDGFRYSVTGTEEWSLMGTTVYSKMTRYSGTDSVR
jgi:hypothetical protein